ncbi:hypothetical protein A2291_08490 [candidate division WOR-1 bacterium RIFOXYB2_FULL_42_35]|uniref:Photosynthesis system II assembly factor Ycf48/Hcf136-like domain-containing protein n=1 Tax=candidate division WOR-1 bacterium RIFOXYC2_FULL_41_25 TaxID=1802586 RepID=A0A1F4TMC9_UNCSA|nr:MAG: hypothetical protein A2247_05185 [candidate division WOR-1 bacterium RIFOXYA2_FULL_41_14]OGC23882.1 MAG: hypothetical protein A2291_08490 [candidate division WOR-1 bacterium RIFOXYB2_FULL_42_35]OGC33757.1 MAG: hypothetical protein A2462_00580 [candidate division WOR-1 bacterium RIFOXYC2_FULL_41_25]OGC44178.1 MAG: hypothetical protein A2548_02950 [candidate division WOR-1 bacterium RIFOXYD2_FULL_41_8]
MIKRLMVVMMVVLVAGLFVVGCGSSSPSGSTASWTVQTSRSTAQLNEVFFYDSSNGWIAANGNLILKTTNEGTTWTTYEVAASNPYDERAIYFLSSMEGYIAGGAGRIYKTSNGGPNWTNDAAGSPSDIFYGLVFANSTNGCAVGNDGIYVYGGSSWAVVSSVSISEILYGVTYNTSSTRYYIVGADGKIMYSNAGPDTATWTDQTSPTSEALKDITFPTTTTGWIVGDNGLILKTVNSGTTWSTVTSGVSVNLRGVSFSTSLEGWVVGNSGTILHTTDGGTNWNAQTSGTSEDLIDVFALSGQSKAWAVGTTGTILKYE